MNDVDHIIRRCRTASRPGLYIMVFVCMMSSCEALEKVRLMEKRIDDICACVEENKEQNEEQK